MPPKMDKIVVNGKDITGMPHVKLLNFAQQLYDTLMLERRERNEAQIFCDYTKTAWDEARETLKESKKERLAKALLYEKRKEDVKGPLKERDQARKYYVYDAELYKKEMENRTRKEIAEYTSKWEQDYLVGRLVKKTELKKQKDALLSKLRTDIEEYANKQNDETELFKNGLDNIKEDRIEQAKERMKRLDDEFNLRHRMEIVMINEMYNDTITKIKENHKNTFGQVKSFYKETTENDVLLIDSLTHEYSLLLNDIQQKQLLIKKMTEENEKLLKPLKKAKRDFIRMDLKLNNYKKDVASLEVTTHKVNVATQQIAQTKRQIADYLMKNAYMKEEDNNIKEFVSSLMITENDHKKAMEERLQVTLDMFNEYKEKTDEIINKYKDAVGLDEFNEMLQKVTGKPLREGQELKRCKFQLAKYTKAHNDTIKVFSHKLGEVGVLCNPKFPPVVDIEYCQKPAGLVTRTS